MIPDPDRVWLLAPGDQPLYCEPRAPARGLVWGLSMPDGRDLGDVRLTVVGGSIFTRWVDSGNTAFEARALTLVQYEYAAALWAIHAGAAA